MPVEQPPQTKTAEGETGTGQGEIPGGGGTPSPTTIYYGFCFSGSHNGNWIGPDRDAEQAAQYDCRDHNAQCDTQGGHVVSRSV